MVHIQGKRCAHTLKWLNPCVCMLPRNPKFNYSFGPISNGYKSLNINSN